MLEYEVMWLGSAIRSMGECNLLDDVAVLVSREFTFQPDQRPEALFRDAAPHAYDGPSTCSEPLDVF